jgi:hypothetical protein
MACQLAAIIVIFLVVNQPAALGEPEVPKEAADCTVILYNIFNFCKYLHNCFLRRLWARARHYGTTLTTVLPHWTTSGITKGRSTVGSRRMRPHLDNSTTGAANFDHLAGHLFAQKSIVICKSLILKAGRLYWSSAKDSPGSCRNQEWTSVRGYILIITHVYIYLDYYLQLWNYKFIPYLIFKIKHNFKFKQFWPLHFVHLGSSSTTI